MASDFKSQTARAQQTDPKFGKTITLVEAGKLNGFIQDSDELWKYQGRLCVPAKDDLKSKILEEAYHSSFTIHSGIGKMDQHLKRIF